MGLFNNEIKDDKYTKKAQELYDKLNISEENYLSVNDLAAEYQQSLLTLLKNGVQHSSIYNKR